MASARRPPARGALGRAPDQHVAKQIAVRVAPLPRAGGRRADAKTAASPRRVATRRRRAPRAARCAAAAAAAAVVDDVVGLASRGESRWLRARRINSITSAQYSYAGHVMLRALAIYDTVELRVKTLLGSKKEVAGGGGDDDDDGGGGGGGGGDWSGRPAG